jgi:hypothetical protein
MNTFKIALALVLASGATMAGQTSEKEQAMAATAALGKALKAELVGAMQSGGPLSAVDICHTRAPAIAASVSSEQGVQVSRVSSRNRNPGNAPNEWQAEVLAMFADRIEDGEDAAGLTWQETAEVSDGAEYRFMKAIPTDGVCLACHGTSLDPAVAEAIAARYPEDKATGFSQGDLRGAFVVTKKRATE